MRRAHRPTIAQPAWPAPPRARAARRRPSRASSRRWTTLRGSQPGEAARGGQARARPDGRGRPARRRGARQLAVERPRGVAHQRAHGADQAQDGARALRSGSAQGADPDALGPAGAGRGGVASLAKDLASEQEKVALLQKYVDARKIGRGRQAAAVAGDVEPSSRRPRPSRSACRSSSPPSRRSRRRSWRCAPPTPSRRCSTRRPSTGRRRHAGQGRGGAQAGRLRGRAGRADDAKKNADQAAELAKPLYEQAEESSAEQGAQRRAGARRPRHPGRQGAHRSARRSAAPGDRHPRDVHQARAEHRARARRHARRAWPACSRSTRATRCR